MIYLTLYLYLSIMIVQVAADQQQPDKHEANRQQVIHKFLERQQADLPVAGVFEMDTRYSDEWKMDRRKEAEKRYKGTGVPLDKVLEDVTKDTEGPELVCEWAYDGQREVLKALPEARNQSSFFKSKEYYVGSSGTHFRIYEKPLIYPVPGYRPHSFYFGITDTWKDELSRAKTIEINPELNKYGGHTLHLISKSARLQTTITIELDKNDRLRKYAFMDNTRNQLLGMLEIESFHEEGQKAFPNKARHIIYQSGKPQATAERVLKAKEISFPKTDDELARRFSYPVPKNAHLTDDQLKQQGYVARDADIQEVLDKKVPLLNMVDTSTPLPPLPKGWPAWVWLTLGAGWRVCCSWLVGSIIAIASSRG